jgi:hypothetical protein
VALTTTPFAVEDCKSAFGRGIDGHFVVQT